MRILIVNNRERLNQQGNLTTFFKSREFDSVEVNYTSLKGLNESDYLAICLSGTGRSPIDSATIFADEIELIRRTSLPVLGICGGFHLMSLAYGGTLKKMDAPIYGRQAVELVSEEKLFTGLPTTATFLSKHRYCLDYIPPSVEVIARHCESGCAYGVRIAERLQYGFQFHPERRNDGTALLDAFLKLVMAHSEMDSNE